MFFLAGCGENTANVPLVSMAGAASATSEATAKPLDPLPPAPTTQILDEARVFAHVPGKLSQLAQFLADLKVNEGIEIYVAMYGFLTNESVEQRAQRLRRAWADHTAGIVVVYESGGSDISFVATDEIDEMLTVNDINMVLQKAGTAAQEAKGAENKIEIAVHTLSEELVNKLNRRREANALTSRQLAAIMSVTLAAIALVTLLGSLLAKFISRADKRAAKFYYFPGTRVSSRFGAHYSGGMGSEVRFK